MASPNDDRYLKAELYPGATLLKCRDQHMPLGAGRGEAI
jgi:hypothetical protein